MLRALILAGLGLVPQVAAPPAVPVMLSAADGVAVYGRVYVATSGTAPVILLFHQADSSKSEYASIAPRLVALGYNVLAIDQRSGGDLYAPGNETVRHLGKSAPFLEALPDMDAALVYAQRRFPGAPVVAWGSSYSAALVFPFAAKHPHDIAALLAFSPAEYFDDKHLVTGAAKHVRIPAFIDSASDADEERKARDIFTALRSPLKIDFVPKAGVHGSATLRDDRDPAGAEENWEAVTSFLARALPH
jgi:dienelactone hydrolase